MSYIEKIEKDRLYTSREVLDLKLIPTITSSTRLYNLTAMRKTDSKTGKVERTLATEVTKKTIPSVIEKTIGNKRVWKHQYRGKDIIKFLELNGVK